ncbi:MAG: hydroxymethylbilane synthase [Candidatus Obscuribacterales bacterium]|nr:hydroxymethylbilane synthase [Candidatus Obscuribacterales bacterium]
MSRARDNVLRVGTRESLLARLQTDMAVAALSNLNTGLDFELVGITTHGDKVLNKPLADIGGRGVFVKELEEALYADEVDLVVHSLKDLPTEMPDGLVLGATLSREDPRDVLVCNSGATFEKLPSGSRVATSSRRRAAQLLAVRQDLEFVDIRGNIQTRLRKHDEGMCDAMVLAAAGLLRLNEHKRIVQFFDTALCTPAVGQGALGLECRRSDSKVVDLLKQVNDSLVLAAVQAERAFLNKLGGGCSVPVGALAVLCDGGLELTGCVASLDGRTVFRRAKRGSLESAESIGHTLALEMIGEGAGAVLEELLQAPSAAVSPP